MKVSFFLIGVLVLGLTDGRVQGQYSVASYNLDNYRLRATSARRARTAESRRAVVSVIHRSDADIVALQEVGSESALANLRESLNRLGHRYAHSIFNRAPNQEIHCAILSRFPVVENRSEATVEFELYGRQFSVLRGICEVRIALRPDYHLTLVNLHLKSNLPVWYADPVDYRIAEAAIIRRRLDEILATGANLIVAGDLNDSPGSITLRTVMGKGRRRLMDCRPEERFVTGTAPGGRITSGATWTHHYERRDEYYRYDYLLISDELKKHSVRGSASVPVFPKWKQASDHRLVLAEFVAGDGERP